MPTEIKPCPLDGSQAQAYTPYPAVNMIYCTWCGLTLQGENEDLDLTIERWNDRTDADRAREVTRSNNRPQGPLASRVESVFHAAEVLCEHNFLGTPYWEVRGKYSGEWTVSPLGDVYIEGTSMGISGSIAKGIANYLIGYYEQVVGAVLDHRNQLADDRCIEDDDQLYAALNDGIKCRRNVGSKVEMLRNCERFIDQRCQEGGWVSYADLKKQVIELTIKLKGFQ